MHELLTFQLALSAACRAEVTEPEDSASRDSANQLNARNCPATSDLSDAYFHGEFDPANALRTRQISEFVINSNVTIE